MLRRSALMGWLCAAHLCAATLPAGESDWVLTTPDYPQQLRQVGAGEFIADLMTLPLFSYNDTLFIHLYPWIDGKPGGVLSIGIENELGSDSVAYTYLPDTAGAQYLLTVDNRSDALESFLGLNAEPLSAVNAFAVGGLADPPADVPEPATCSAVLLAALVFMVVRMRAVWRVNLQPKN